MEILNLIDYSKINHFFFYQFCESLSQFKEIEMSDLLKIKKINTIFIILFRWVLIIIFFEILIPPEPFMRDAPHFFYRKYNKNLL